MPGHNIYLTSVPPPPLSTIDFLKGYTHVISFSYEEVGSTQPHCLTMLILNITHTTHAMRLVAMTHTHKHVLWVP